MTINDDCAETYATSLGSLFPSANAGTLLHFINFFHYNIFCLVIFLLGLGAFLASLKTLYLMRKKRYFLLHPALVLRGLKSADSMMIDGEVAATTITAPTTDSTVDTINTNDPFAKFAPQPYNSHAQTHRPRMRTETRIEKMRTLFLSSIPLFMSPATSGCYNVSEKICLLNCLMAFLQTCLSVDVLGYADRIDVVWLAILQEFIACCLLCVPIMLVTSWIGIVEGQFPSNTRNDNMDNVSGSEGEARKLAQGDNSSNSNSNINSGSDALIPKTPLWANVTSRVSIFVAFTSYIGLGYYETISPKIDSEIKGQGLPTGYGHGAFDGSINILKCVFFVLIVFVYIALCFMYGSRISKLLAQPMVEENGNSTNSTNSTRGDSYTPPVTGSFPTDRNRKRSSQGSAAASSTSGSSTRSATITSERDSNIDASSQPLAHSVIMRRYTVYTCAVLTFAALYMLRNIVLYSSKGGAVIYPPPPCTFMSVFAGVGIVQFVFLSAFYSIVFVQRPSVMNKKSGGGRKNGSGGGKVKLSFFSGGGGHRSGDAKGSSKTVHKESDAGSSQGVFGSRGNASTASSVMSGGGRTNNGSVDHVGRNSSSGVYGSSNSRGSEGLDGM